MDLETRVRRFEQQLAAFEKLHADELKSFEEKLATYRSLQADEVRFLREELAELKRELAAGKESNSRSSTPPSQSQPHPGADHSAEPEITWTRRELLSGAAGRRRT
jgi:hypothetical protein